MMIKLTTSRSARERYYLINDGKGMGSAGEPAEHYSHKWVIANGVNRGNGFQGYMSVDYALSLDWFPETAKAIIRRAVGIKPPPEIGERCICSTCGQELEWNGKDWWDRGADKTCGPEYTTPHTPKREPQR